MIRLLFLVLLIFLCSIQAKGQNFHVDNDSLETTILINPNDLLHSVSDWDIATTDGFTYRLNSGLYGFYGPQPTVYLDNIPIDLSFFNWQNLNMLPVSMDHISEITFSSKPQVRHHNLARAGYLNLNTTKPDTGFNAYGSFAVGNQSEDPGPWSYDSSKVTPNIDRRGPHYFSHFSYRSSDWYTKVSFSLRQHQPTNLNNHHRLGSYSLVDGTWHAVKTTINNGLVEVGYEQDKWEIKSRVLYSENEEYLFYQPFGREIPATTGYRQWVLDGSTQLSGTWTIQGQYLFDEKKIDYRLNNKEYNFDWSQLNHRFSAAALYNNNNIELKTGGILQESTTEGLQLDNQQYITTLYGEADLRLNLNHNFYSKLNGDFATNQSAISFLTGSNHQLSDIWQISTDLDYNELLSFRQQNSTYWIDRGYDIFSQLDIPSQTPFSSEKNRSFQADITNKVDLGSQILLTIGGKFIHHYNLNIPWQEVAHDDRMATGIYTQPQHFEFTSEKGLRIGFDIKLDHKVNNLLSHNLKLRTQHTLDGSSRYGSYWQQVSNNNIEYKLRLQPVSDLRFSILGSYQSPTKWIEYKNLEDKQYRSLQPQYPILYGTFHTETPSFFNLHLTAQKDFWDKRFVTTFSIRNLLNTEVRYHTLGLDKALQFIIKASLTL